MPLIVTSRLAPSMKRLSANVTLMAPGLPTPAAPPAAHLVHAAVTSPTVREPRTRFADDV
jgi:hypothetical protein